MTYAGKVSTFEAEFPSLPAGTYTLRILASDQEMANFSMHESELEIR